MQRMVDTSSLDGTRRGERLRSDFLQQSLEPGFFPLFAFLPKPLENRQKYDGEAELIMSMAKTKDKCSISSCVKLDDNYW